jgi:GNAT superfamily N-acetyltransferase
MNIRIRRYRPDDRKAVLAAFRTNVPDHFPASEEAWLRSALDEPDGPLFVAVEGDQVVAFGGYELSDFYNLGTLVFGLVRADRHGTGIGRALLHYRLLHMAGRKGLRDGRHPPAHGRLLPALRLRRDRTLAGRLPLRARPRRPAFRPERRSRRPVARHV